MSAAGELFMEQVQDALYEAYPIYAAQVRLHYVETPDWAYQCWDERKFPDKFTVRLLDVEEEFEVAKFEVSVDWRVEGSELEGRYIEAYVASIRLLEPVLEGVVT